MAAEPGSARAARIRARIGSRDASAAAGSSITATSSTVPGSNRQENLSRRKKLSVRVAESPARRADAQQTAASAQTASQTGSLLENLGGLRRGAVGIGASGEAAGGRLGVYLDDLLQAELIQIGKIPALARPYLVEPECRVGLVRGD